MNKTAFVMMPSGNHGEYKGEGAESDYIYEDIIRPALAEVLGKETPIIRQIDTRSPGAITRELINHIATATVCVVDVTGLNPNVFLELGVRYALRKSITILLRQHGVPLPFDINDYRCVEYSPFYKGPQKAKEDISAALRAALAGPNRGSDSLVFNALSHLRVEIPGVVGLDESPTDVMPWEAYWRQFEIVVSKLHDLFRDGVFVPKVVLGISNGGLIYADLLGRHLFNGIPILSLWANRLNIDDFFDNTINDGVISGIASRDTETTNKMILLVDDIVASGATVHQAVRYLRARLDGWTVCFLPLFSRNPKFVEIIREHLIWFAPHFRVKLSEEEVRTLHVAEMERLPYKKEIRVT